MRKINNGLWSVLRDDEIIWVYINTLNSCAYQFEQKSTYIAWKKLNLPKSAIKYGGYAYGLRANGGERLNPDDTTVYNEAVTELGGIPDMIRQGFNEPSDDDCANGWVRDVNGGCVRRITDSDKSLADFIGCNPWEIDEVFRQETSEIVIDECDTVKPTIVQNETTIGHVVNVDDERIPVGMVAKDFGGFTGFAKRPRAFKNSQGRKILYVAFNDVNCVVAYRDWYERDSSVEAQAAEYLKRFGWQLTA